jgi:hypothetical protein
MADTRQRYHGWTPRIYGPRHYIPRANLFYWRMEGRAWFGYLRKASVSKRVKFVFDCPMSTPIQRP